VRIVKSNGGTLLPRFRKRNEMIGARFAALFCSWALGIWKIVRIRIRIPNFKFKLTGAQCNAVRLLELLTMKQVSCVPSFVDGAGLECVSKTALETMCQYGTSCITELADQSIRPPRPEDLQWASGGIGHIWFVPYSTYMYVCMYSTYIHTVCTNIRLISYHRSPRMIAHPITPTAETR